MSALITFVLLGAAGGACLGSFANVVASRGWRGALEGRSRCDACARTLQWPELVPVVSFAALKGRCRTCGARIARVVMARELGGALVGSGLAALLVGTGR